MDIGLGIWPIDHPAATALVAPPNLALSQQDDLGIVLTVDLDAAAEALVIRIDEPAAYAGEYTVSLDAIAQGAPICFAPPRIEGAPAIGELLTVFPGLWLFDADAYMAAGQSFTTSRAWTRNGVAIAGSDQTSFVYDDGDAYAEIGHVETAVALDGTPIACAATPIAPTATLSVTRLDGQQRIDASGVLADARGFTFAALLALRSDGVNNQYIYADSDAATLAAWVTGNGKLGRSSNSPDPGNVAEANVVTSKGYVGTAPSWIAIVESHDLDQFGMVSRSRQWRARDGAIAVGGRPATADAPADVLLRVADAFSLFGLPGGADRLSADICGFVWVADQPVDVEALAAALFAPVDTAINASGFAPRVLPDDGVAVVGGAPVAPKIFLRGANLGQTETTPGVWVVPNRAASGQHMPLVGGPFA